MKRTWFDVALDVAIVVVVSLMAAALAFGVVAASKGLA